MTDGIFAPAVVVNNLPVGIKPNSFTYKEGGGERKVRTASAGGESTTQIITEDVETKKGYCKFTLYSTSDNVSLFRQWQSNGSANTIEAVDNNTGFSRTFQSAIVMNDPDINLGVDGEFEVECESKRPV